MTAAPQLTIADLESILAKVKSMPTPDWWIEGVGMVMPIHPKAKAEAIRRFGSRWKEVLSANGVEVI